MKNRLSIVENETGFSLIEVLVTLVIISAVLVPLFQVQQVLNRSSSKLKNSTTLITSADTILSFLSTINPMVTPKGSQKIAGLTLDWECKEMESFTRPGLVIEPQKRIALYNLNYTLSDETGRNLETRSIKIMGWEESF